jgi:kexin
MALWGSAIDSAKAQKFLEPVIDNALPETNKPGRPVMHDSNATSIATPSKPTPHTPTSTSIATETLSSGASGRPMPQDDASEAWYGHMTSLLAAQKWYFAALGAVFAFAVGAIVFFWRRRVARQRLENYTSLAADDINMDVVGQSTVMAGQGSGRAIYDAFAEPSSDDLPGHNPLDPPSARGLGFHSGFLDDDEPSAGLPKYQDEPEVGIRSSSPR